MSLSDDKKQEWSGGNVDIRTADRTQYIAAPSAGKGIIARYEQLIDQAVEGRESFDAVVFGATPEVRDMVLARNGRLTTVDQSEESIAKCNLSLKHQQDPRETIVMQNWLVTTIPDASADIVLGDGIFNNIPFESYGDLFRQIVRVLREGGYCILREGVIAPSRSIKTVEEISAAHAQGGVHWFDSLTDLRFYSDISESARGVDTYSYSFQKLYSALDGARTAGRLSEKLAADLARFRNTVSHTVPPHDIFRQVFSEFFEPLSADQANDFHFTQDTMLFFFGKTHEQN